MPEGPYVANRRQAQALPVRAARPSQNANKKAALGGSVLAASLSLHIPRDDRRRIPDPARVPKSLRITCASVSPVFIDCAGIMPAQCDSLVTKRFREETAAFFAGLPA
jgi:hypothetical protein